MKNFFQRNVRRLLLGALGVTLIAGGLAACGHRDHTWGAGMTQEQFAPQRDKMVDRVASKLDLNAEQKKLLANVGDKLFEQRKAMIGQTSDPRAELKSLIAGPKFDTAKAQARLARTYANVLASELIAFRANWTQVHGKGNGAYGPMAKMFSSEAFITDSRDLMDLTAPHSLSKRKGGAGHINEAYRHAHGTTIYGGTSQVHRSMIAEKGLGLPRSRN